MQAPAHWGSDLCPARRALVPGAQNVAYHDRDQDFDQRDSDPGGCKGAHRRAARRDGPHLCRDVELAAAGRSRADQLNSVTRGKPQCDHLPRGGPACAAPAARGARDDIPWRNHPRHRHDSQWRRGQASQPAACARSGRRQRAGGWRQGECQGREREGARGDHGRDDLQQLGAHLRRRALPQATPPAMA